jgi:hypothetical protein
MAGVSEVAILLLHGGYSENVQHPETCSYNDFRTYYFSAPSNPTEILSLCVRTWEAICSIDIALTTSVFF